MQSRVLQYKAVCDIFYNMKNLLIKNTINIKILSFITFIVFILLGFFLYEDYGISLDERHHREHAFFWYTYSKKLIYEFFWSFTFVDKVNLANTQLYEEMSGAASFVGSPLSIFSEFLIEFFNVNGSKNIFEFRHLFNFFVF